METDDPATHHTYADYGYEHAFDDVEESLHQDGEAMEPTDNTVEAFLKKMKKGFEDTENEKVRPKLLFIC